MKKKVTISFDALNSLAVHASHSLKRENECECGSNGYLCWAHQMWNALNEANAAIGKDLWNVPALKMKDEK